MNTQGNPVDRLLQSALAWVSGGDFARAAILAEEAATLHGQAGRTADQALTLQLAAALKWAAGDTESSRVLSLRAARIAPENLPITVASLASQAEAAAAQGHYRRAADIFGASLENARAARLPPSSQIALLRRRGACQIADGDYAAADTDFAAATDLASPRIAAFLRTEQARLLLDAGQADAAARVLPEPDLPEPGLSDPQLLAEIEAQKARLARATGDVEAMRQHASAARSAALVAVAPVPYFTASVELAEAFDLLGRRTEAYTIMTTAWATLSDLLGSNLARSWIEPCLIALQLRWGDAQFSAVKQAHDARRRADREAGLQ